MLIAFGHGALDEDRLTTLLRGAALNEVVDIRRFPHSRHNPDVESDAMTQWLPRNGIAYSQDGRLGGRRRLPAGTVSEDPWWRVPQFAAYAAHTRTTELEDALREIIDRRDQVAVMCSESVWWRCHRRLVADVAVLRWDVPVEHLMHDGRLMPHTPSPGARIGRGGQVFWDTISESS